MLNRLYKILRKNLEKGVVKKNYDLYMHNSYRLHCRVAIAVIVNSLETFCKTIAYCEQIGVEPIIIGNGTNIILAKETLDNIAIIFSQNFAIMYRQGDNIVASSGVGLSDVVKYASANSLEGMEQAIGIPGTVGGAVVMNAQAFDFCMDRVVKSVLVYMDGKIRLLYSKDCKFGYRTSMFQHCSAVILRVEFGLKQGYKEDIHNSIKQTIRLRQNKQSIGYPNAGSVFRNGNNYFAGELIDKCGLKNYNINNAYVSDRHANFIVNHGGATGEDILRLIAVVRDGVYKKFGVELELEQKIIGDVEK